MIIELREVQLKPNYLRNHGGSSTKTKLFGVEYDAPFGIAPIGLQGLMWPNSPEILAKARTPINLSCKSCSFNKCIIFGNNTTYPCATHTITFRNGIYYNSILF